MLPDIAAEVLQFLSRRDLDKACGVSKWLDAVIAKFCNQYPLRPVAGVQLFDAYDFTLRVMEAHGESGTRYSFSSMDEAAHFAASILRHSYVGCLELCNLGSMTLFPDHWTTLFDSRRNGAVRCLQLGCVDFSALDNDAFLVAVGSCGLQSLDVQRCVLPSGFVTDDLLRKSVAKGVRQLCFLSNEWDIPPRFPDAALLDCYFSADTASGAQSRDLKLEGTGLTDMFLAKFFERIQSSPARRSGSLTFYGAAKQRGLTAFAQYEMPDEMPWADTIYRFPPVESDSKTYMLELYESSSRLSIQFYHLPRSS